PLLGLRAALPLPRSWRLSIDWVRGVGKMESSLRPGGSSLAVLTPPLWTARPGYSIGLDLRATAGVGLYPWEGHRRIGIPAGLHAHAALKGPLSLSAQ